jgi:predicted metal-dependent hydrolase
MRMDVERIQKINNLAVDLVKQGLANDREEAIAQAEKIFKERDSGYSSIRETTEEIHQETKKEEVKNNAPETLSQDKIKDILEQNTKYLISRLKEFESKIATMENEISIIKTKAAYQTTVREVVKSPEQKSTSAEPPKQEKPKESHPRSGNYNEDDVSIEKFFYTGNK